MQECVDKFCDFTSTKGIRLIEIEDSINIIDRSVVKQAIMRFLYGSNSYTISKDIRNKTGTLKMSSKHISLILALFFNEFKIEYMMLKLLSESNSINIKSTGQGLTIDNGFTKYSNTYMAKDTNQFKFRSKGKLHRVEWYESSHKINVRKSNISVRPNAFHSIDSFICLNVIKDFLSSDKNIVTIHDAYIVNHKDKECLIKSYNKQLLNINISIVDILSNTINNCKVTPQFKINAEAIISSVNDRKSKFYHDNLDKVVYNSKFSLKENVE